MNKSDLANTSTEDDLFSTLLMLAMIINTAINSIGYHNIRKTLRNASFSNKESYKKFAMMVTIGQLSIIMLAAYGALTHINNVNSNRISPFDGFIEKAIYLVIFPLYAATSALGWKKFQEDLLKKSALTIAPYKVLQFSRETVEKTEAFEHNANQQSFYDFNKV